MAESNKINVQVKTPKEKKTISTSEDAEIKDVSKVTKIGIKIALFIQEIYVDKHVTAKASYMQKDTAWIFIFTFVCVIDDFTNKILYHLFQKHMYYRIKLVLM